VHLWIICNGKVKTGHGSALLLSVEGPAALLVGMTGVFRSDVGVANLHCEHTFSAAAHGSIAIVPCQREASASTGYASV
jgi:hypothetical protein